MSAKSWLAKAAVLALPVAGLTAASVAARPGIPLPGPAPTPAAARTSLSQGRFYLGVRETDMPGRWAPVAQFSAAVHESPSLVLYYSNWRDPFRYGYAKEAHAHGAAVIVQIQSWKTPLNAIAHGSYDKYLRSFAAQVRTFGHPVVIGFDHEMNGRWYPWGCTHQSPAAFVAAWRHIVTLFRHEGADNVTWLWTISHTTHIKCSIRKYWPGARYVTWVGLDGYYFNRGDTFQSVFSRKLRQVRRLTHDPVILSEVGIGPLADQAHKLPGLFAGIRHSHLLGLVWFDVAQSAGLYHQDWRLEGHQAAVAAFRRGVAKMTKKHPAG